MYICREYIYMRLTNRDNNLNKEKDYDNRSEIFLSIIWHNVRQEGTYKRKIKIQKKNKNAKIDYKHLNSR